MTSSHIVVGGSPAMLHKHRTSVPHKHVIEIGRTHDPWCIDYFFAQKQLGAIHLQRCWYHWLAVTADLKLQNSLGALLSIRCPGLEPPSSTHPGGALCQATSGADSHWKHSPHHCPCMHHPLVGWPESVGKTCGETGGLIWPGRACCLLIEAGLAF